MITSIIDWLDHRAGVRKMMAFLFLEGVPGGAKWRYVWGSTLAFVFSIQLITGILLMTAYSPSSSQAWNSVHFIQYKMDFGWLIRGLHHFGSQTMVVLIALHMLQVVIAGAHLPPREVNWWLGIGLLSVTFGLSLTGYLLPWDQKGYWATRVATNIASNIPVFGDDIKQLAVGGPDYGNHTLTRFYALHVAILPLSLIVLLVCHITIFRRHGVTSSVNVEGLVTKPENEHSPGSEEFWPRQSFYDMLACMAVFAVMMTLVLYGFAHEVTPPMPEGRHEEPGLYDKVARAGIYGKGAELDAAADRDTSNYPARPEWYFLFLFQLLKYFPGEMILVGTVFIPNGVMLLLTLLPVFGYGSMRKIGHFFGMLVMMTLLILVGMLTLFALRDDAPEGILFGLLKNTDKEAIDKAESFQHSTHDAEEKAKRACQLAMDGTPVEGGHFLIRNDPYITGRELFAQKCGSCHGFTAREDDAFRRIFWLPAEDLSKLENPKDLAPVREELKKKGILLSEKFKLSSPEEGKPFRVEITDLDWRRDFLVERQRGGLKVSTRSMTDGRTAGDLGRFGAKDWVRGIMRNSLDEEFFGHVKIPVVGEDGKPELDKNGKPKLEHGLNGMKRWNESIKKMRENKKKPWDKQQIEEQEKLFELIAEFVAEQAKPRDKRNHDLVMKGQEAFGDPSNKCADCHSIEMKQKIDAKLFKWDTQGGETAPDLSNYGSADWIRGMIMRPGHISRYRKNNTMPAFRNRDGPDAALRLDEFNRANKANELNELTPDNRILHLSDIDREMIIRWMVRDYRPIYGGADIAK